MSVIIDLNKATRLKYINLRELNCFSMQLNVLINGLPVVADDYEVSLSFLTNGRLERSFQDSAFEKSGSRIDIRWESFPLRKGTYQFDVTWKEKATGKIKTIIPGSLEIIARHE